MEITLKDLRTLLNNKDALEKYTINIDIVKKDINSTAEIWTDGAYKPFTNQGGWAIVTKEGTTQFGGVKDTTNNRMELTAVIEAIKLFDNAKYDKCIIYSDSQYVISTINKGWKKNKNCDLWDIFDNLDISNITFVWVKGHDGNIMNEKADELAVRGSELFIPN